MLGFDFSTNEPYFPLDGLPANNSLRGKAEGKYCQLTDVMFPFIFGYFDKETEHDTDPVLTEMNHFDSELVCAVLCDRILNGTSD